VNERERKKLPRRLCEAAAHGRTGDLARLLGKGADPDARCEDGATPLYLAAVQGEARCVARLLAAGASPDLESTGRRGGLPLAAAAANADLAVAGMLLRYGADPNLRERSGTGGSALDWSRGWEEDAESHRAVEELLLAHADSPWDVHPDR
jgi:ankyrin repeat protein